MISGVYLGSFYLHFKILNRYASPHSHSLSKEFLSTLEGNGLKPTYLSVGYGDTIAISHVIGRKNIYLHSHNLGYPGGSQQQQVTGYEIDDINSRWVIKPRYGEKLDNEYRAVRSGDIVQIAHKETGKYLHSHVIGAAIEKEIKRYHEVSGYGDDSFGDDNNNWMIEIVDKKGRKITEAVGKEIKSRETYFRLVHVNTGRKLTCLGKRLPKWGYEQISITCGEGTRKTSHVWRVERSNPSEMGLGYPYEKTEYRKLGFLEKFLETNQMMWSMNNSLLGTVETEQTPIDWLFMKGMMRYWTGELVLKPKIKGGFWDRRSYEEDEEMRRENQGMKVNLIGNVFIWWTTTIFVISYLVYVKIIIMMDILDRGSTGFPRTWKLLGKTTWIFFLGYILHLIPFFK